MSDIPTPTRLAPKKRTYRKNQPLFALIGKMKLWPSRRGILHGIRSMEVNGDHAVISTHCGKTFLVRNARTSRASRWLRNKIYATPCPICRVPDWKLEKYQGTAFRKKSGAVLREGRADA
ncbi:pyrrolysine--tRNA(Pyl) ligase small subunit [uncultured Desulfovibrio sp.]|uniref:pyrrolysine--tRNA(Pyl) ligase small subunit n=1 Tax=uncultured Desulfovibrio sp. TaxID=167968 RepID=UPI0026359B59|nr:pyrrolysine--tRNA(Pyl) ligase small subunit [uncultured Desulfovibrio sp.]